MLTIKAKKPGVRIELPSGRALHVGTTPRRVPASMEEELRKSLPQLKDVEEVSASKIPKVPAGGGAGAKAPAAADPAAGTATAPPADENKG